MIKGFGERDGSAALVDDGVSRETVFDDDELVITSVKRKTEIEIDFSLLTWGDALLMQKAARAGDADDEAMETMLTEVVSKVIGQDATQLPARVISKVVEQLMEFGERANADRGNSARGS